jgi:MFS family permease
VALMSASHVVDDIYQGCVPALLPFLVAERHCTYAAVSGLTLAATVLSSVAQPAFGWWTDRRPRRWMIPVGMSTAGIGVALSGLSTSYVLTWLAFALSGLGIAAFQSPTERRSSTKSVKGIPQGPPLSIAGVTRRVTIFQGRIRKRISRPATSTLPAPSAGSPRKFVWRTRDAGQASRMATSAGLPAVS